MKDIQDPASALRRILIVDDNRDAADSLGALLGLLGHEVHVAYDAFQALAMAQGWRPHIVLMDLGLPGMSGQACARQMRAQEWARELRVVAVTGRGHPTDRPRSREAAFDEYLVKPVSLQELQRILGDVPRSPAAFMQQR